MEQFIKDGVIKELPYITINYPDGSLLIRLTRERVLQEGWIPYVDEATKNLIEYSQPIINTTNNIENNQALKLKIYFNEWSIYIGKSLVTGQIVKYKNTLYRVRQDITIVLENQFPSLDTAALYEVIVYNHEGTTQDPIPYKAPMTIYKDKYYVENNIVYLCTRDSETALTHNLSDLIDQYVTIYQDMTSYAGRNMHNPIMLNYPITITTNYYYKDYENNTYRGIKDREITEFNTEYLNGII